MTKKNFVTLVLGVVGGLLFGIGMCMCLLPGWYAFKPAAGRAAGARAGGRIKEEIKKGCCQRVI